MYVQNQYNYRTAFDGLHQAIMQHKGYIDQLIDNYNRYGSSLSPQQLSDTVGNLTKTNNYLQSQLGQVDHVMKAASMYGDNDVLFRANNLRSTILGMDSVVKNFTAHIYNAVASSNQYYNQYVQQPNMMLQQGYNQPMNNLAMRQQAFLAQTNTTYNGFGEQRDDRDKLMISARTNPAGWNATNISTGSDLDAYDQGGVKQEAQQPTQQETQVTYTNNYQTPEGFQNEFDQFNGNKDLEMLLQQYGVSESIETQLPDKNNNGNLTAEVEYEEKILAKNEEIAKLTAELNKLKEEIKMEKGIRDNVVDISFNEFLLDQDNKSMSASYRPNGLKIMVQVGELPKPIIRDIETCDYSVADQTADMTTLTFNNLIESSLRRTRLAEQLLGELEADKILICSDFMSSIVSLVGDKVYTDDSIMQDLAKEFIGKFKRFQTSLENCYNLPQIYDAIESLNTSEFGKKVTEYFKVVLKDELNDFFRYSIETVAGNLIKGELDRSTAEVIDTRSTSTPVVGGWLDTTSARKVYKSFIFNLKDMFQNFFDVIDIGDETLPNPNENTIPVTDDSKEGDDKCVSVFLKVKTRTFGIRFDESLDKLTNGKQIQGVVTMESNPELHNILDHCVTDPENKRSTKCKFDYVPGNNHLMICSNPGINVCYRIYPRYDVKGDGVVRKGFFIKMMSSY